ncbi:unnamed protein product [Chilo suppressalis]|uniref:Cytochrome P450 CYP302A1 n=2 Tax=Chilo suppressalis TaxID=168631 RepID=A0ABN8BHG6_CHISP|nr:unnamed protein product [Chilo suppressalis]
MSTMIIILRNKRNIFNNYHAILGNKICARYEHAINKNEVVCLKRFHDIPGPKCYPLIGTLHQYLPFIGDYDAEAMDKNAMLNWRRYGPLVREHPGVRLLHLFDPEDIEAIFRHDDRYPVRRSHLAMFNYRTNKRNVYNTGGLLSTNGEEWWKLRSTFQKNFTSPKSVKVHVENTDQIVRKLVKAIKETYCNGDDFLKYLNRLNLEIVGVVAFNETFDSFTTLEQNKDSRSSKTIAAAFGSNHGIMKLDKGFLWKFVNTPLYKKLVESQEYLEKVAKDILIKRISFYKQKEEGQDNCLLKSFLNEPNIDMKDITGMMVDILMAAIDTTAFSTSFVLYHLARNKECQDRVYKEILSLLACKDSNITPEIVAKANYTRCCVKESLRLNPVAIGVGRVLQKDIALKGYLIPKDTVIVTQNMVASRLPQYVKNPLIFKPERWLRSSPEYENIHPFLSLPFGFGPRSCIARRLAEQNICITIMRLIREFEIGWMGGELGIRTHLINKPNNAVTLSFSSRDSFCHNREKMFMPMKSN